jgi:hypothetical protein
MFEPKHALSSCLQSGRLSLSGSPRRVSVSGLGLRITECRGRASHVVDRGLACLACDFVTPDERWRSVQYGIHDPRSTTKTAPEYDVWSIDSLYPTSRDSSKMSHLLLGLEGLSIGNLSRGFPKTP